MKRNWVTGKPIESKPRRVVSEQPAPPPYIPPDPDKPELHPTIVKYHPVWCPACGSDKTAIYATAKPIRYHRCNKCGRQFRSVEVGKPVQNIFA